MKKRISTSVLLLSSVLTLGGCSSSSDFNLPSQVGRPIIYAHFRLEGRILYHILFDKMRIKNNYLKDYDYEYSYEEFTNLGQIKKKESEHLTFKAETLSSYRYDFYINSESSYGVNTHTIAYRDTQGYYYEEVNLDTHNTSLIRLSDLDNYYPIYNLSHNIKRIDDLLENAQRYKNDNSYSAKTWLYKNTILTFKASSNELSKEVNEYTLQFLLTKEKFGILEQTTFKDGSHSLSRTMTTFKSIDE